MYPFAIINFAGGGTPPVEKGLKQFLGSGTQCYFALGHNGDLYVMGGASGNGLGRANGANVAPSGWTLTNTGVDQIYPGVSNGFLIRKGSSFYSTGQYNGFPGSQDADTQNDWRLIDPAWYNLNGYSVFDNMISFSQGMVLCSDGKVYTYSGDVFTEMVPTPSLGIPAGTLFKYLFVSNDAENKILISTTGAVYAQGYNGMGFAMDGTGATGTSWLTTRWKQVRDCTAGYDEAYILQSRRLTNQGSSTERHTLIVARKEDGTWWVSGTQNTGLGNSSSGSSTTNVMKASTIPPFSKVLPGEAYGFNATNLDRNWYIRHQVFVENENLGVHQSTGDQGSVYTLANGTTYSKNCNALTNIAQILIDEGGLDIVVPHAGGDRSQRNLLLTKTGKLYFTGLGVSNPAMYPPGFPANGGNQDYGPGYNLSGPYEMPDFG